MRRTVRGLAAATVSVGLLLGPAAGTSLSAGTGTGCVWTKHSKRIVKHVKRHGERRRVVRVKRWWTCVPQATAPAPVSPTPAPTPPPTDPDPVGPSRLGVESAEWSYTLSRPSVQAGDFIVELNNSGEDAHNLNIAPGDGAGHRTGATIETLDTVAPGGQTDLRFDIAPGTYYLFCSLPTHEGLGMSANLVVDG